MLRKALFVTALWALVQTPFVWAHGGGHGPVDEAQAKAIALDAAGQFASFDPGLAIGQLDASWNDIEPDASRIEAKGDGYYIVAVANKVKGKTLYILMSLSGDIYDANFTGDFPKVK